jgi:putative transcriptional regulator
VTQTLIRWNLNEVMARYDIRASDLAQEMGVSNNSVSNLRTRSMPRLSEETLDKLCRALNKLKKPVPGESERLIKPGSLIDYIPNDVATAAGSPDPSEH